ncbi:MAG: stability determinant [Roseateles sp.]|uniref:type II toxin-antitoxin system RelB family antitoxin n=1 Tax=Roseateles sp. TaxID=1971397 RepID=UPI0039E92C59
MNAGLSPLVSEFETAEQEASYAAWLRAKVAASLADPRPAVPHDEVERRMAERLLRLRERVQGDPP